MMLSLIERTKASLHILGYMTLIGGLMDFASTMLAWKPTIFFLPVFILGWCFLWIAAIVKYGFDKLRSNGGN